MSFEAAQKTHNYRYVYIIINFVRLFFNSSKTLELEPSVRRHMYCVEITGNYVHINMPTYAVST